MGFFSRDSPRSSAGVRASALVVDAEAPPQGAPRVGSGSSGIVRLLVDPGSGPVSVSTKVRFKEQHWLVRGMDVPVTLDPSRPGDVEIDFDGIPSMEERAAANDPALADPLAAGRRVAHALGLTKADTGTARTDRFKAAMAQAEQATAPPGRLRAVILVATHRGRYESGGDPNAGSTSSGVNFERNSAAVWAVNIPGRAPYAVFVGKFKYPRFQRDITGAGLPALVSASDPQDIEVLWAEVPSLMDQVATRMSDAAATDDARRAPAQVIQQQMLGALQQPDATAGLEAMAPQMRRLAAESARKALLFVQDPAQREMLLAQYRAAGIIIEDADEQR